METYTKHQIVRIKDIDRQENIRPSENNTTVGNTQPSGIYEVVFKPGTLNFLPGSRVRLYKTTQWFYVASGLKEPWCRLLVDSTETSKDTFAGPLKIGENLCMFPGLIEDKSPAFYCSGTGIALPMSYISTFPDRKVEIVYLGPAISLEFLKARTLLKRTREEIDVNKQYYCTDGVKRYGQGIH